MRNRSSKLFRILFLSALFAASIVLTTRLVLADEWDWRNVAGGNYNTDVRSQIYGTCWDYGSVACLEARYKITRNDPLYNIDLSEQQILSETNPDMGTTNGGLTLPDTIYDYFKTHGVVSETELPLVTPFPEI